MKSIQIRRKRKSPLDVIAFKMMQIKCKTTYFKNDKRIVLELDIKRSRYQIGPFALMLIIDERKNMHTHTLMNEIKSYVMVKCDNLPFLMLKY